MKKFGFGKKDDGDDANRSSLFGSRSKNKSPNPAAANPYAQSIAANDPYTQAKISAGVGGFSNGPNNSSTAGPYGGAASHLPNRGGSGFMSGGNYAADNKVGGGNGADNRYGGGNGREGKNGNGYGGGGYGSEKLGAQSGYGEDRYGATAGGPTAGNGASRYGPGGYGGLGRADSNDATTEDARNALFDGAKSRLKQPAQQTGRYGQPPPYEQEEQSGVNENGSSQGYGAYQDRQLTAEEEEEEDVQATKQQIRFMKQEDVSSTRNALRMAQQAEETGRATLARLGAQGENIHNTEKNLDLAHNQNRIAEEKARELKTLNKSMFAVHVSNPFTASQRRQQRDDDVINKHLDQKEQREATRRAEYQTNQRLQKTFKDLQPGDPGYSSKPQGKNLAERAKYQFEADSEDDEMENEIDSNLDALSGAAGRLNALARATGDEVDIQNKHLDRISEKGDRVDLGIAANRAKLDRFH
ncbi:Protein transport protein S9 plasma membrane t-SNARE [Lignoscripta atroalba]|nr:Protein transport protein S9 plasma membrane t-SNARE [Lignoscripta atroalba]